MKTAMETTAFMKQPYSGKTVSGLLLAAIVLSLGQLLIFQTKIGVIVLVGALLLLTSLLRPRLVYLLLVSLFSVEGFTVLPGASIPKIVGIVLITGLALRIAIRRGDDGIPRDNAYLYYFLFLAGCIFSLPGATNLPLALSMFGVYLSLFAFYVLTRYFLGSLKDIDYVLNCLVFSTVFFSLLLLFAGLTPRADAEARVSGGIGDSNEFASYLLVVSSFSLYMALSSSGLKRIAYWGCVALFLVLLILSGSRGGLLGLLSSLGVIIYHYGMRRLKEALSLLLIVAGVFIITGSDEYWTRVSTIVSPDKEVQIYKGQSIATRMDNYGTSWRMFIDNPLRGVGLYNFKERTREYGGSFDNVVHNTYLEILTGGGLLSFIPFLLLLIDCWRKTRVRVTQNRRLRDLIICSRAAFVSVLITSFFLSADHKKITWFLLALISSVYYMAIREQRLQFFSERR